MPTLRHVVQRQTAESLKERLEALRLCIENDDYSRPEVVRSALNDIYLILLEVLKT